MKTKTSSYQKLKLKIQNLEEDIYNMVEKEDEQLGMVTKLRYKLEYKMERQTYMGEG